MLNFNVAALLAFAAPPLLIVARLATGGGGKDVGAFGPDRQKAAIRFIAPLYLWFAFFSVLPHKVRLGQGHGRPSRTIASPSSDDERATSEDRL